MKRKIVVLAVALTFLMLQTMIQLNPSMFIVQAVFGPEDIFWETGFEEGTFVPPFSEAGISPGGWYCSHEDPSGVWINTDSSYVRTGSKSLYCYQHDPPKDSACRRITNRYYGSALPNEYYLSWWVYFPSSSWSETDSTGYGVTLGGIQVFWGTPDNRYKWWAGARFGIESQVGNGRFRFSCSFDKTETYSDYTYDNSNYTDTYLRPDNMDKWVHFQVYWKYRQTATSIIQAWIDNVLVLEKTNFISDPRAFSEWTSKDCAFPQNVNGNPPIVVELYQATDSPSHYIYVDDCVGSTEKVTESYGVGGSPVGAYWGDGFESGDLSKWNATEYSGGGLAPSVTSTYAYAGTYSLNVTTNGSDQSYSRVEHIVQDTREIWLRSYVRFEQLPNTGRINFLRVADSSGDSWITVCAIYKNATGYYWTLIRSTTTTYVLDTISAQTWYCVELYLNLTVNGNMTMYANDTTNTQTGDFSSKPDIGNVYGYIYISGTQDGVRTVLHDQFAVDDERIGTGTPVWFQGVAHFYAEGDGAEGGLEGVKINGTETDGEGLYQWQNLTVNNVYTFVVECPSGYYPAWVLNVEGSFNWNGTYFILSHNVTVNSTNLGLYFYAASNVFVNSCDAKLTSAYFSNMLGTNPKLQLTVDKNAGESTTEIDTDGEGNATYVYNAGAWQYDLGNDIVQVNITHSSAVSFETSWGFMATHTLEELNMNYSSVGVYPYLMSSEGVITDLNSTATQLTFTVRGTGATRTDVYTRNFPLLNVTGEETYIHDETNDLLKIYVSHSSDENVTVGWGYAPPPLFEWPDFATYLAGFNTAIFIYPVMIVGMVSIGLVMLYYGRADAYEYVRSAPWLLVVAAVGIIGVFVYYFVISAIMGAFV